MGSIKLLRSCTRTILFSALFFAPVAVYSATITSVTNTFVTAPFCLGLCGAQAVSITTSTPNNDEVGGVNGNTVIQDYTAIPGYRILADYLVTNSGGTTEYQFTHKLTNVGDVSAAGLDGHEVTLETGLSNLGLGLDFDFPDIDPEPFILNPNLLSPGVGVVVEHTETNISWLFHTGKYGSRTIGFALDLPDCGGASGITCDAGIDSYTVSILHQFSPVPIPAAAWLFLSGLLGLIGVSARKANC